MGETPDYVRRIESDLQKRVETIKQAAHSILNDVPKTYSADNDAARVLKAVDEKFGKKRLFVCCDGTWKNASGTIEPLTNVARLARCVGRVGHVEYDDDGNLMDKYTTSVSQVTYYSPGVGSQSALLVPVDSGFSGATGKGVTASILNAYCFLCNNYNFYSCKDEIILVGYSRGAFTVRCLAAFINDVGLIRRKNLSFLRCENENNESFSHMARIKVLAEWDTVSSMGVPFMPWKSSLSFVQDEVPYNIDNAFFALALDEERLGFTPMAWKYYQERCQTNTNDREGTNDRKRTNVRQCAFRGCHADIGGGNPDAGLSTISLLWMIAQIQNVTFAKFDLEALLQFYIVFQSTAWKKDQDVGQASWGKASHYVKNLSLREIFIRLSLGFGHFPIISPWGDIMDVAESRSKRTKGKARL
ncbi:hypothetical protein BDW59DRAFT_159955 [Aspergillus cavernicola]|uniref:T6SS Phospholipase effector Tle1-like catalytic domain-containing protein n=1 Tax=Aspergillus cavernicola TaxID=176166 RepID=A0ABR4IM79_9EURO